MKDSGFLEVTTPCLVEAGAIEGSLAPIEVSGRHWKSQLHTSPEISMKALLSRAQTSIYQITPCFRDEETGPQHRREFLMLEFYRWNGDYHSIQEDSLALLRHLSNDNFSVRRTSVEEALEQTTGLRLSQHPTIESLRNVARQVLNRDIPSDYSWEDIFFTLFLDHVESKLAPEIPTLIQDFPTRVSPLSEPLDGFYAKRFEIFWRKFELCNGSEELSKPDALKHRIQQENSLRIQKGLSPHPFPNTLLAAMEGGHHLGAGVAFGLERLWAATLEQSELIDIY